MKRTVYWPGMQTCVEEYCKKCVRCAVSKMHDSGKGGSSDWLAMHHERLRDAWETVGEASTCRS